MSVLNKTISLFPNALATKPSEVNLLEWLNGNDKHNFLVDQIRATTDKYQRDQFKKQLPCITPSGVFVKRSKAGLLIHSGLIAFDIDNIGDSAQDIKSILKDIPNIAYCGLSVSGQGLWGLIPISEPDKHEAHFRAIELAFAGIAITIDPSCKDVSRLRFYSYDNEAYFNHSAIIFDQVWYDHVPPPIQFTRSSVDRVIQRACNMILNSQDGQKYFNLNKASFLLGGYIGAGKINENEARQSLRAAITERGCLDVEAAFITIDKGLKDGAGRPVTT